MSNCRLLRVLLGLAFVISLGVSMTVVGASTSSAAAPVISQLPTPSHSGASPNWRSIASSFDGKKLAVVEAVGDVCYVDGTNC